MSSSPLRCLCWWSSVKQKIIMSAWDSACTCVWEKTTTKKRFTGSHCGTINRKCIGKKGPRCFEGWFCARVLRVSKVAEKELFDVRITARWSQQHQPLFTRACIKDARSKDTKWTNFQPVKRPVRLQQHFMIITSLFIITLWFQDHQFDDIR